MIHALWLIPCIFISVWIGYAVCAMMVVSKKNMMTDFELCRPEKCNNKCKAWNVCDEKWSNNGK